LETTGVNKKWTYKKWTYMQNKLLVLVWDKKVSDSLTKFSANVLVTFMERRLIWTSLKFCKLMGCSDDF